MVQPGVAPIDIKETILELGKLIGGSGGGTYVPLSASGTVTVSPKGIANGLATSSNNGAQFGPDTPGTTTSGIQEALTSIAGTGGKILLLNGAFTISSAISITTDYSISIEGVTRGREENTTSSTYAYGVFLMVNGLGAGVQALTINTTTGNLGMLRLSNFTMRGQALGYTGSTTGTMYGIDLAGGGGCPAQVEIDNVGFEYVTNPVVASNGLNGPVIIDWIGFFFCTASAGNDGAMLNITTGTCNIGHIEVYACGAPTLGITGTSTNFSYMDIDSIFVDNGMVMNFGCLGGAPTTFLHIGSISLHNPTNSAVFRMEASSGSLYAHVDKLTWGFPGDSQTGQLVQGTGQATSGRSKSPSTPFVATPNISSGTTTRPRSERATSSTSATPPSPQPRPPTSSTPTCSPPSERWGRTTCRHPSLAPRPGRPCPSSPSSR